MNKKFNKLYIIPITLTLGILIVPNAINCRITFKNVIEERNKILEDLPKFEKLVNDLTGFKSTNIDRYLEKNIPKGLNVSKTQEDDSNTYEVKLENTKIYIQRSNSKNKINSIQYSKVDNENNLNSLDYFYSKPQKDIYNEEELKELSEEEKTMIENPNFVAVCNISDYKTFNKIYSNINNKSSISSKVTDIIDACKKENSTTIQEVIKILGKDSDSVLETNEYENDYEIKCATHIFEYDNETIYVGLDTLTNKVWAIQYTYDNDGHSSTITFKNNPLINADENIKFYINANSNSINNISNVINAMSEAIK